MAVARKCNRITQRHDDGVANLNDCSTTPIHCEYGRPMAVSGNQSDNRVGA
jgi:hypothetical protein